MKHLIKKELIINLKSLRIEVSPQEYKLLMEADANAYQRLGERLLKKIGPVGMGYMIESIEEDN